MIRRCMVLPAILLASACATAEPAPPPPPGESACMRMDPAAATAGNEEQATLLLALPDCLEDPDPAVRDSYAFTTLSEILRSGGQDAETVRRLMSKLLDRLARADEDPDGFRGPFAVLALAEVARVDRLSPFLTEEERWDLLMAGKAFLAGLDDYRGFSDTEGWRHGVAHSADLLMQLSLNPHLSKPQADEILAAIASKAGTPDHAYVFGEDERLAAPVLYLARKKLLTPEEWSAWFTGLWPADDPLRDNIYGSEAALTKRHNLRAFVQTVYVNAVAAPDDAYAPLDAAAFGLLVILP